MSQNEEFAKNKGLNFNNPNPNTKPKSPPVNFDLIKNINFLLYKFLINNKYI